jgi:hypothetical protein
MLMSENILLSQPFVNRSGGLSRNFYQKEVGFGIISDVRLSKRTQLGVVEFHDRGDLHPATHADTEYLGDINEGDWRAMRTARIENDETAKRLVAAVIEWALDPSL